MKKNNDNLEESLVMLNQERFVNICLCLYNGADFINQQLLSCLEEKNQLNLIIISDDGSSDSGLNIINEIFEKYDFDRFIIITGPKKGAKYNFLSSLRHCDADFIFLADQDDVWHKDKINIFLDELSYDYDSNIPLLMFSDATLIDENGNKIHESFFDYQGLTPNVMNDDSILYKNCVQGASCCINRALLNIIIDSLDYIDIDNIYMHDWWIALLARYYGEYHFIDKPLIDYRQHEKNQVGVFNKKFRFLYYITQFSLYFKNFKQAIRQVSELERFTVNYQNLTHNLLPPKSRKYGYISKIKRIVIKLLKL